MTQDLKTPVPPAASGPTASGRRFLAQLMEHAFREGWRTPDDFVKHFPAHVIMAALKSAPELRVAILAAATGIYEEILRRKSPALAAEDLRLALDEGTTNSQHLLAVFSAEDRIRFLDPRKIWDFLAEDQFWQLEADASEELRRGATERVVFTLTQALQERLLTLRDILDGLTYEAVADSLSPHELRSVVRYALVKGRDGIGLNEKVLLEVLPLEKIVRSLPLEHIWHEVVIRRLAIPAGLTDLSREERRASQAGKRTHDEPRAWSSRPPALPQPALPQHPLPADEGVTALPPSAPGDGIDYSQYTVGGANDYGDDDVLTAAPPPVSNSGRDGLLPPAFRAAPRSAPPPALPMDDFDAAPAHQPLMNQPPMTVPQPPLVASRPSAPQQVGAEDAEGADRQRQRVTEHLRAIGRLPPRHSTMPAAVLRSIDAMYALLPSATDDIQRKSVIRQAFANENYLRAALLGLIELMDSSVDTSDSVIQEAKIEALIKILLFEEQRRKETGRFPTGPFSAPRFSPSSYPPSSLSPNGQPSSSRPPPGSFSNHSSDGFYYPPPSYPPSQPPPYPQARASSAPHVATQRPPPPVLSGPPSYPGSVPPLPNLPAEPQSSRRRTMPPPLPPSFPRG